MANFKKYNLLVMVLGIFMFLLMGKVNVQADDNKIGIAPSFINNIKLNPGESKEFEINVANKSVFLNNKDEKNIRNNSFKVHLKLTEMNEKLYKDWVNFETNDFILKPQEIKKIKIKITIPKDVDAVEYPIYIDFIKQPIEESQDNLTHLSSSIQVPIFINNGKGVANFTYQVVDFQLSDKTEDTPLKDIIKGLLTFKSDKWKELWYKPYKISYNSHGMKKIIYDIPKSKKTEMKNVITHDKSKLNDSKYIYIPSDLTDESKIEKIDFTDNSLVIYSNKTIYNILTPNQNILFSIREQLTNLSSSMSSSPNMKWMLDTLKLEKSLYTTSINLYGMYSIKNTGNVTIVPTGKIDVFNEYNKKVDSATYSYTIIKPSETKQIISVLNYDNYTKGSYTIKSNIIPYNGSSPIEKNVQVEFGNIRRYIIGGSILILIIIISLPTYIIIRIIKKKKRKNNIKNSQVSKTNTNEEIKIDINKDNGYINVKTDNDNEE